MYMKTNEIFKPGVCRPQAGMRLVSYNHFHSAKVCVCVYAPKAINNYWHDFDVKRLVK